jgi:hypothetical protein
VAFKHKSVKMFPHKKLRGIAQNACRSHAGDADLSRKVKIEGRDATVDGLYLRIVIHANEHMGQLVAYAPFNRIVPPWSQSAGK